MQYYVDFRPFIFANEGVILEINPCASLKNKPNIHIFYSCSDASGFQISFFLAWVKPPNKLQRTKLTRAGNKSVNIFVYSLETQPF